MWDARGCTRGSFFPFFVFRFMLIIMLEVSLHTEVVLDDNNSQKKKKKKNKKRHLEEQVKENADKKQPKENEVMKMDEPDHKLSNEK